MRSTLAQSLALRYPFNVVADPDGGYVVVFPDLPGCMTQVEEMADVPAAADEIRVLWIETEHAEGREIPAPSYPEEYSGKFNLRLPRSLHRRLVESAARDGVSLNHYVSVLLDRRDSVAGLDRRLTALEDWLVAATEAQPAVISSKPSSPSAVRSSRSRASSSSRSSRSAAVSPPSLPETSTSKVASRGLPRTP